MRFVPKYFDQLLADNYSCRFPGHLTMMHTLVTGSVTNVYYIYYNIFNKIANQNNNL